MIVEEHVVVSKAKAGEVTRLLGRWRCHVVWTKLLDDGRTLIVYRYFQSETTAAITLNQPPAKHHEDDDDSTLIRILPLER